MKQHYESIDGALSTLDADPALHPHSRSFDYAQDDSQQQTQHPSIVLKNQINIINNPNEHEGGGAASGGAKEKLSYHRYHGTDAYWSIKNS